VSKSLQVLTCNITNIIGYALSTGLDFPYNFIMAVIEKSTPIDAGSLEGYFRGLFGECRLLELKALGSGVHGTGFLATLETGEGRKSYVLKNIAPEGLGHDYPPDRAAMFLLALENYGKLPNHVRAIEVLSLQRDGTLKPIGGGREYFLLMERAEGTTYFKDLEEFSGKETLDEIDREKIRVMAGYLREMHSVKKESRTLYLRKLRDIIGHGECLMGVFDSYPEGVLSYGEMARIEMKCLDWRARLKGRWRRLSQIHGDFHPGNVWWKDRPTGRSGKEGEGGIEKGVASLRERLCLLDRSRGAWGEPADDLTAMTINYVFFSIKHFNSIGGAYLEGFKLFFDEYMKLTGDREVLEVLAPFYAFRGAVVANPVFYPELSLKQRKMIFGFVEAVLGAERFEPERVEEYIRDG
jgi:hypothetical protein